jgi:hypothetical protein
LTSDHGHTEVVDDPKHALASDDEGPPAVLRHAGFRVRAPTLTVSKDADFQAVLAYGGAMAYVYLADRSECGKEGTPCVWAAPPRFEEDVMVAAEAFARAHAGGTGSPRMKGTLDLILARHPKPFREDDEPFQVYADGKLVPIDMYLSEHPHPTYVDVDERLRDLAAGKHGERAGDLLLIAHNGDRDVPTERYYFAKPYRSWHGSPSHQDSDVPLIVANASVPAETIASDVQRVLGSKPRQQKITDLMLGLRYGQK